MTDEIQQRARGLYTPPFRFECGYIFDRNGEMVADMGGPGNEQDSVLRVRGWGRIQYLDNPEELQDSVGEIIADLLSKYWSEDIVGAAQRVMQHAESDYSRGYSEAEKDMWEQLTAARAEIEQYRSDLHDAAVYFRECAKLFAEHGDHVMQMGCFAVAERIDPQSTKDTDTPERINPEYTVERMGQWRPASELPEDPGTIWDQQTFIVFEKAGAGDYMRFEVVTSMCYWNILKSPHEDDPTPLRWMVIQSTKNSADTNTPESRSKSDGSGMDRDVAATELPDRPIDRRGYNAIDCPADLTGAEPVPRPHEFDPTGQYPLPDKDESE